jgi:hypothetical protein
MFIFKNFLKNIFLTIITFVICIVIVEIIFNILPTSDSEQTQQVDKKNPYLHLIKNKELLISSGTFFENKSIKRTNNFGFFSDIDYEENGKNKNIIVIGSSLVTANQVSNSSSFHGLINSQIPKKKNIYMLGGANAPHSQYLAYTKLAIDKFNPSGFVFVIGSLDFKGSLINNALPNSGYHYFSNNERESPLVLNEYRPSKIKIFFRNFATARYLFLNARVQHISLKSKKLPEESLNNKSSDFEHDILMENFLFDLQKITKKTPVLLVINSFGSFKNNYLDTPAVIEKRKKKLILISEKYGFEIIDLNYIFSKDFKLNKTRFESSHDESHWNVNGHRIVAKSIMKSALYENYIKN